MFGTWSLTGPNLRTTPCDDNCYDNTFDAGAVFLDGQPQVWCSAKIRNRLTGLILMRMLLLNPSRCCNTAQGGLEWCADDTQSAVAKATVLKLCTVAFTAFPCRAWSSSPRSTCPMARAVRTCQWHVCARAGKALSGTGPPTVQAPTTLAATCSALPPWAARWWPATPPAAARWAWVRS